MDLPNIFTPEVSGKVIQRINALKPTSQPNWGKMNVGQMLAHCNVTYELIYEGNHPSPNFFMKFFLKTFIKKIVTGKTPYKHNSQTAPNFIIKDSRDFEKEQQRLIGYIDKTQKLGETYFLNKESHSLGVLNTNEWNNMLYKHLDHHLQQFGV